MGLCAIDDELFTRADRCAAWFSDAPSERAHWLTVLRRTASNPLTRHSWLAVAPILEPDQHVELQVARLAEEVGHLRGAASVAVEQAALDADQRRRLTPASAPQAVPAAPPAVAPLWRAYRAWFRQVVSDHAYQEIRALAPSQAQEALDIEERAEALSDAAALRSALTRAAHVWTRLLNVAPPDLQAAPEPS